MCYLDRLLLSQRQREGLDAGFLHFWQHLRLKWPTRWFRLPKWRPGMCTWVKLCACVHENTVVKRCWLSLHTCLHLQDRPVCLCECIVCHWSSGVRVCGCVCVAVFVQRCFGLRALTHRSSLKAARRMCALDCDHHSCEGLYFCCLHPFISPSSTSSPFSASEDTRSLTLSAMTVWQQKHFHINCS